MKTCICAQLALVAALGFSGIAHADLQSRGNLVYDSVLDVTWGPYWGYTSWQNAMNAAPLITFDGYNNWRLPTANELTSLYDSIKQSGSLLGGLAHFGVGWFWSSDESDPGYALFVNLGGNLPFYPPYEYESGQTYSYNKLSPALAITVRSGDIAAVPEPETYAMLLAGLGLVGWTVQRRKQAEA